ncbi:hypothetical protein D3C73_1025380 [compost metagenome]
MIAAVIIKLAKLAIGPIINIVAGALISKVRNGTKVNPTISGILLLITFSTFEAKYTAKIIGTTVDPYPVAGNIIGIPKNVLYTAVSKIVPVNKLYNTSPDARFVVILVNTNTLPINIPVKTFDLNALALVYPRIIGKNANIAFPIACKIIYAPSVGDKTPIVVSIANNPCIRPEDARAPSPGVITLVIVSISLSNAVLSSSSISLSLFLIPNLPTATSYTSPT